MGTNGVLSIVDGVQVQFKIVAGSDGGKAIPLAREIKNRLESGSWKDSFLTEESLYHLALTVGFGSVDCLTVVSVDQILYCGSDECPSPDSLYRTTFECAHFNPRWGFGIADYIVRLDLGKLEIRAFRPEWSVPF